MLVEDQSQISPSKHDGLNAAILQQPLTGGGEHGPLCSGRFARSRHGDIGVMDTIQVIAAWWDDLGGRDASVEARLHDGPSSQDPNPPEPALFDGRTHHRDHVDNRKRRHILEPVDTKMAGDRGDSDTAGACGNESVRQTLVYCDLRPRVVACEMSEKRRCVGMNDRQFERGLLARKG